MAPAIARRRTRTDNAPHVRPDRSLQRLPRLIHPTLALALFALPLFLLLAAASRLGLRLLRMLAASADGSTACAAFSTVLWRLLVAAGSVLVWLHSPRDVLASPLLLPAAAALLDCPPPMCFFCTSTVDRVWVVTRRTR
jgi:hypothetical protein